MHLWEALQVRRGEIISFVGAGGKTTAMYHLAQELARLGWRVITTTTTMIRPPSSDQTERLIVTDEPEEVLRLTKEALQQKNLITLASRRLQADNKLKGIEPGLTATLAQMADVVIVEADGAKGLSLKAPADHEPVVPAETALFVPLVGMDAVGQKLTAQAVHRPELVSTLTGLILGETITPQAIARLLIHPQGALKGAPAHARIIPLLNKVHSEAALATARQVAHQIKGNPLLTRVLIGAVATDDPITECWRRVSAIVLAAGGSKRFGIPKQLLPVNGTTMIEHILNAILATSVDEVIVVLGHAAAQVAECIPSGCRTVLNKSWEEGISSSIQAGLRAIDPMAEAAIFVLADQPCLTTGALECILQAYYGTTKPIVVPIYQGQRGSPVLFDRRLFVELQALHGDVGGRRLVTCLADQVFNVEMPSAAMFLDIDTPADYEKFMEICRRPL